MFIDTEDEALRVNIEAYPKGMKNYPGYDVDLSKFPLLPPCPLFLLTSLPSLSPPFFFFHLTSPEIRVNRLKINYLHASLFPMVLYFKQFFQYLKGHLFALILEVAQLQLGLMSTKEEGEEEEEKAPSMFFAFF
jgi:hypothetical protein